MKNYDISDFYYEKLCAAPIKKKNERGINLPFCSDITDISDLIALI